jgi:ribose 1,5-bisphosphokinase
MRMAASLIYVVGASGSGKDSLMRYGRERLSANPGIVFAHRYITRAADAGGENHVALSAQEFAARDKAGLFALHWKSHGHSYGIGIEVNQWLAKGVTVVVNGSREHIPEASRRYRELSVVWIEVSTAVLRERLLARGRESEADIEERLGRHRRMLQPVGQAIVIANNGPLAEAGENLVTAIQRERQLTCV